MMNTLNQLKRIYSLQRPNIRSRLREFKKIWSDSSDEVIFTELAFCILTPQSKAKVCWSAIEKLRENSLLLKGDAMHLLKELGKVRFKNKKTAYIVRARTFFSNSGRVCIKSPLSQFKDIRACREWLVRSILGIGYKEASHFLRNIGLGEKFAILDRHVLKNLREFGVIKETPQSIGRTTYIQIENNMLEFAQQIGIPVSHLDLLFWYKETGEIFK